MPKKMLPVRIDVDLLARVDVARGDVSRTRWVVRALESALGNSSMGVPDSRDPGLRRETADLPASSRASLPAGVVKASSLRERRLIDVVAFGPPAISAARARVRLQEGRVLVAGLVVKDGSRMVDPSEVRVQS